MYVLFGLTHSGHYATLCGYVSNANDYFDKSFGEIPMPHRNQTSGSSEVTAFGVADVTSAAVVAVADGFGFTTADLNKAFRAIISSNVPVRYRYDGGVDDTYSDGDPTATIGHGINDLVTAAPHVIVGKTNIGNLKFIAVSAAAVVTITIEAR